MLPNVSSQKLLDRIPHLAWLMTERGEIVAVNQHWREDIGNMSPDDRHPRRFAEILHPQERESWSCYWEEANSLQTALNLKIQLQDVRGNWEWFKVELDSDGDEFGQTTWICTAMRLGGVDPIPNQHQSIQFLEALLTNASDGIVACDADGHLVLFNPAAQAFHGMPPASIEPEDWATYYDLYDRDGLRILTKSEVPLFRALQGEVVISQEMTIKSKLGGDRSLLASGTAIYSTTGEKLGAVVLMRDITAYRQAETERLRVQLYTERLSIAMRVAKAGAWTWDLSTQQIFLTPEFELLFDYEPGSTRQIYSESSVEPWSAFSNRIHPDDRQRAEASLQTAIAGKSPEYHCEYRIVWRDGQIRWIDTIGELHPDEHGNDRLSGLVYDITERKRDEEALRRNAEFTRRVLESNRDCIKVLDVEGRLLYMNDGGKLLMEIDNFDTVANSKWVEFWQDRQTESAANALTTALAGGIAEFEGRCNTFRGTPKWWDVVVTPILDAQGKVEQILSVSRDITERKHLEFLNDKQTSDLQQLNSSLMLTQQRLQERNADLDRFVYIASHDLKAPLRAIANLSTWLEEDLGDQIPPDNQQQLQLLRQRVQRMDALIDGLLRYSRVGTQKLACETVDVTQLLAETIDSLSPPPSFEIQIAPPMPILHTKRLLLSQVFANLISNAIKHHHRSTGRIEITIEDLGDRDRFSIADDGPGIPTGAERERIFEIFQTLRPTDSTENTGIGLALIKKIVEGEGGNIWLDADFSPGCKFCFTWLKTAGVDGG